jgi:hypothetical protein
MLQDKRSAARCAEISHTVRSYVSVTLPSLADSLRSKREDLHELKLALQQWPGEQQRHETYISVLVSEEGELKRNAQALEQAIIGSETAKRHREHVRKTLASNEGAIVDDLDFDIFLFLSYRMLFIFPMGLNLLAQRRRENLTSISWR